MVAALKIKPFPSSFWNMQWQHWIKMANVFRKTEIMLPFKRMDVCSILFPCLTWKIGLRRCQLTAKSQFLRNTCSRAQGEEVKSLLNLKLTKFEYSQVVTSLWTKDWGEKPSVSRSRGPVPALFTGQVVFQSHNNPAKSYCLDFTNGERTPERTEVIFFKTLAPQWGNDWLQLRSLLLSTHIVMKTNKGLMIPAELSTSGTWNSKQQKKAAISQLGWCSRHQPTRCWQGEDRPQCFRRF